MVAAQVASSEAQTSDVAAELAKEQQLARARCPGLPTDNHILLENEPALRMLLDELERFIPRRD